MRCPLISIFLFLSVLIVNSKPNSDLGIFMGGANYMGQMNPTKLFYKPSISYGVFYRYNINERSAARLNLFKSNLKGEFIRDEDIPPGTIINSFKRSVMDLSAQYEFNFTPYLSGTERWLSSTYVAGGVGLSFIGNSPQMVVPFGLGFKINITDRLSAGAEWSFRKTFTDKIDGVQNPNGNKFINNNDWYSFFGLFISYKFFKFADQCPAYK